MPPPLTTGPLRRSVPEPDEALRRRGARRTALLTILGCAVLLSLGHPGVQARLGAGPALALASVQSERLNRYDALKAEQGYYEGLLNDTRYTSTLRRITVIPEDWETLTSTEAVEKTSELWEYELRPEIEITFKRAPFQTNRWGMRDRDYALAKPPGTYRVALLGASHTMGSGVDDDQTFENLAEDRLNQDPPDTSPVRYEILNFAVGGHGIIAQVALAERRAFDFEPDAVLYVVHPEDAKGRTAMRFARTLASGHVTEEGEYTDETLWAMLRRVGISDGMEVAEIEQRLSSLSSSLTEWAFARLAALCARHGTQPALALLATTDITFTSQEREYFAGLAQQHGFVLFDLSDVYEGFRPTDLSLSPWDNHPNVFAHGLIAGRLHEALREHYRSLGDSLGRSGLHASGALPLLTLRPVHLPAN